jgi:hypothetical protein
MTKFRRRLVRLARAHPHLAPVQVLNIARAQHGLPKLAASGARGKPGIRVIRLARARRQLAAAAILRLVEGQARPAGTPARGLRLARLARARRVQVGLRIARLARTRPHLRPMQVVRRAAARR